MPPTPSSRYWARRRSRVAGVQARADPARHGAVLGPVGVEQEERHAPDVDAPDLRDDLLGADGDGDRDRLAVVAGDERHRLALGIGRHPRLVLPARGVDALAEVALAVEQADGDERQRAVGGLLEDVAGQRPEAAGVDRQRGVDAVLGAEEAHRALGAWPARWPRWAARRRRGCSPRAPGRAGRGPRRPPRARARRAAPRSAGGSGSRRTAPSAGGRRRGRRRRRRASTTSAGCTRPARAEPTAWARERQAPPRPGRCPRGRATRARMMPLPRRYGRRGHPARPAARDPPRGGCRGTRRATRALAGARSRARPRCGPGGPRAARGSAGRCGCGSAGRSAASTRPSADGCRRP